MSKFSFTKIVDIDRDKFFAISTNYEKFTEILPEYFLDLKIIESEGNVTKVFETLKFLGKTVNVTTEHVIEKPDRHIVKMLDGQAKDTIFDEKYEKVGDKTKVTIEVDFVLSGGLKILGMFAKSKIESSMKMVLDEFANYAKKQSQCRKMFLYQWMCQYSTVCCRISSNSIAYCRVTHKKQTIDIGNRMWHFVFPY